MTAPTAKLQPYNAILPYTRVEFPAIDGTILRGNFYRGTNAAASAPLVIFVHGLGLVKEQYLENWFKYFVADGYHVLAYDNRSFGHSDGLPRNNFDWSGQAEDFIDAVTFASSMPDVDSSKIFGWGVAHAGGVVAMASARDKRIAGIIMFLPCIDGAWDKKAWGEKFAKTVDERRYSIAPQTDMSKKFWPLTDDEAAGKGDSVLSGDYVREWSVVAQKMAEHGDNHHFNGELTYQSFWNDYNCRPLDVFDRVSPTPLLWVMASNDVVCGPLDFTKGVYDKLQGPKEICVLEGEHLAQYFDPGFPKSVESMLSFLRKYAKQ